MTGTKDLEQGIIFDIKRFSVNDGPGIRTTVFFKGCPLRCAWCHNPESFVSKPQLLFNENLCISGYHDCSVTCKKGALGPMPGFLLDSGICNGCGECVDGCPSDALRLVGRYWQPDALIDEIMKDRIFFDQSGGGVTFSGGEPLAQASFLLKLLHGFRMRGIETAIDTTGYAPWEILVEIVPLTGLFLYDLKLMDPNAHLEYTGVRNELILENLSRLAKMDAPVVIRIPLIPGITDSDDNLGAIIGFLSPLDSLRQISLLNFNSVAPEKFKRFGLDSKMENMSPLPLEKLERIKKEFERNGLNVTLGE